MRDYLSNSEMWLIVATVVSQVTLDFFEIPATQ